LADNFDFIRSERALYEILPKGIGKGTSITKLGSFMNVDINKIIAIGDYNNDISMFKAAGIGVAVSNAIDEVKAVADYIAESNDDDGVAKFIESVILK
jgi:hydroxymethylpyrimidine pyrophosphatase-like HAD family hydrolase